MAHFSTTLTSTASISTYLLMTQFSTTLIFTAPISTYLLVTQFSTTLLFTVLISTHAAKITLQQVFYLRKNNQANEPCQLVLRTVFFFGGLGKSNMNRGDVNWIGVLVTMVSGSPTVRDISQNIGYFNIRPTRCNVTQFILSGNCSTCFGW
jgi:hypothetical protein